MRIYAPNNKIGDISGGHTFHRNFKKALGGRVQFTDSWENCDIFFIAGITIVEPSEVLEAKKAGKKIVLRVDNVPRKSRNRRSTPHQRLKELADLADVVVYQSEWAKEYCMPLTGDGTVIYNGVDQSVFKPDKDELGEERDNRYLFIYHGKNEMKQFWVAHFYFQLIHRKNPKAVFWFINDFGSETENLQNSNFDFWNGEMFLHLLQAKNPEEVADLMQQCRYLIYPAISDACPNVVLEARACGMEILHPAPKELAGTRELMELQDISLERMADEYYGVFDLLTHE